MEVKIKHLEPYLRGWGGGVPIPLSYKWGSDLIFYYKERKNVCCCDDEYKIRHFLALLSSLISTFLGGHMLIKQQLTKKNPPVTTFLSAYKSAATVNPSKLSRVLIISKCLQTLEKCSEMGHQIIEKHWWEQQTIGCFCPAPHLSVTSFHYTPSANQNFCDAIFLVFLICAR